MVHIKFVARPRTLAIFPKFGSMVSDEALEASAECREISTEQLEQSQGGQQATVSMEATSAQGAGTDQDNRSEGFGDKDWG
jgi:hypothetical protein